MKPAAGEKLALPAWAAPRRKMCPAEGRGCVVPTVLMTPTTSQRTGGLKEESLYVLAGVVGMTAEAAWGRPWGAWIEAGGAGGKACLKEKGAVMGRVVSGPVPPNIGLKVGITVPRGGGAAAVTEILGCEASAVSPLVGGPQMHFNMRSAEVVAGDAGAE